ncbi:hypothetical protein ACFSKS_03335 [Pseudocitrobacter faecalis]
MLHNWNVILICAGCAIDNKRHDTSNGNIIQSVTLDCLAVIRYQ